MNILILNDIFQGYLGTMTMTTSQKKREIQVHAYCYYTISSVRSSNSHPDLLVITTFSDLASRPSYNIVGLSFTF